MLEYFPSRDQFRALARQGNLVPVSAELLGDRDTPVSAYAKLRHAGPSFLFESVDGGEQVSRYSFLGCRPRKIISSGEKTTRILTAGESPVFVTTPPDPLSLVEDELASFQPVAIEGMPHFIGGAVGFCGYEYIHRIEPSVSPAAGDHPVPVTFFLFTDSVVLFDRARQTLKIVISARISGDPDTAWDRAVAEINEIAELLRQPNPLPQQALSSAPTPTLPPGNFSREDFEDQVERCREFIRAGDIIQVVLSQRFERPYRREPIDLYRVLRTVNPSPYMFLFEAGDFALVGASPEVHVRLTGDEVRIRPIAGTRPRGATPAEDRRLETELLADEKERAEHLMLVDLARNDIGRVCETGSVRVPEYMTVERYSHVMHIVSQVVGKLSPACNAFDLLRATFPAGTVSGAPKIRAMQIISELEPDRRGPYSGALGYFSYDGNHDSCIAIRTAVLRDGKVFIQAGAGIVADSDPSREYQETVNKAAGILKAVSLSETLP